MAHTNPDISILESGTTTRTAALSIISSVTEDSNDVSQIFEYVLSSPNDDTLKELEGQLEPWKSRIKFKTLSFETDASNQGFDDEAFDIIILSNPLGAVQDPEKTLATTKRLLKPGGKLCLMNVTNACMRLSVVLRCLSSWSR